MTIQIDRNIPIPEAKGAGRRAKYPWALLEVGDSFFVPQSETKSLAKPKTLCRDLGRDFLIAAAVVDGVKGLRAWRTK